MKRYLPKKFLMRNKSMTSAGNILQKLSDDYPHVEVIRYKHKNLKLTFKHINHFSNALAIGFLDIGLNPGDKVLSWLPVHFSEQHVLQFACSKAGLILYHLDPLLAIKERYKCEEALENALALSEANILITQDTGDNVNFIEILEAVVPETCIFNIGDGMPFFTPRFPSIQYILHTGLDFNDKPGIIPLNQIVCPSGELSNLLNGANIDSYTPLAGRFTTNIQGIPTGIKNTLNNMQVVNEYAWPEFVSILEKEYNEVNGIGVVF